MYLNRALAGSMDSGLNSDHMEKKSVFKRYFTRIVKKNPVDDEAIRNEEAVGIPYCGITNEDAVMKQKPIAMQGISTPMKTNFRNELTNEDDTRSYNIESHGIMKNENSNNKSKMIFKDDPNSSHDKDIKKKENKEAKDDNDQHHLFQSIFNTVVGTPAAEHLLSILKKLVLISSQSKEDMQKWQQIDRFVNRTVLVSQDEVKVAHVKPVCPDTDKESIAACGDMFKNTLDAKTGVRDPAPSLPSPPLSQAKATVKKETKADPEKPVTAPIIQKTEPKIAEAGRKQSVQKEVSKSNSIPIVPKTPAPVKDTKCDNKLDELDKLELLLSSLSNNFPVPNPQAEQNSKGSSAPPKTTESSTKPSNPLKVKSDRPLTAKPSSSTSCKTGGARPKSTAPVHVPDTNSRMKQNASSLSTTNRNPHMQDHTRIQSSITPASLAAQQPGCSNWPPQSAHNGSNIETPNSSALASSNSLPPVSAWASMSLDPADVHGETFDSAYSDSITPVVSPPASWPPKFDRDDSVASDSDATPPVRSGPTAKNTERSNFKKSGNVEESQQSLYRMESCQLSDGNASDSSGLFSPRRSEKRPTIFNWHPPKSDDDTTEVESDSACGPPPRSAARKGLPAQEKSTVPVPPSKPPSPKRLPVPSPPPPPPPNDFVIVPDIPGTPPARQRSNSLPQNSKMKTLQWNKIPNHMLSRSNSCIWKKLETIDIIDDNLDKLFAQPSTTKKKKPRKVIKAPEICLLEPKVSMNVNIFLKQFKGGTEEVMKLIKAGKSNQLDADHLRCLEKVLPDEKAVEMLTSFEGKLEDLGEAERFFLQLITIPNYGFRINTLILKEDFEISMEKLKPSIETVKQAIEDLLDNEILPEVLSIILSVGNYMNHGSHAGNASAFKITSLLKLTDTRSNSNARITLLHYIVQKAEEKQLRLLEFPDMMPKIEEASLLSVDHLNDEVQRLKKRLEITVKKFNKSTRDLKRQLGKFFNNALAECVGLEWNIKEIRRLSNDLAEYLCEDPKRFVVEDNLKVFHNFCKSLTKAKVENEMVKEMEARKALMGRRRWSQPIISISDIEF